MAFDLVALLLPLGVIVLGAAGARWLAARVGQPPVLGELLLGLALGASLLGWAWPGARAALFPQGSLPMLEVLGWLGLLFFMFHIGAELRPSRTEGRATLALAAGGLLLPFTLGLAVALVAPRWFFAGDAGLGGAVLVAVVLAVSALPVLGRILEDLGLLGTRVGRVTLGAGAIDDLFAWSLLALVVGSAGLGLTGSLALNLAVVAAVLGAAVALDRALPRLLRGRSVPMGAAFLGLLGALLGAALLTHEAGLHAVLGPLAVGALAARHPGLLAYARPRLDDLTSLVLLPTFFVLMGLATDLTLLGATGWLAVLAVAGVACLGKLGGGLLGARAGGLPAREGVMAAILLNARGAVGLVVAKVGLDEGLLSASGFALLVVVVVLTTLAAPPALQAYLRWTARRPLAVAPIEVQPIPPALRLLRAPPPAGRGAPGMALPLALPKPARAAPAEHGRARARPRGAAAEDRVR